MLRREAPPAKRRSSAGLAFDPPFWYSACAMETEGKEGQSGVKTVLYLFGFVVLTALAIVLEIKYRGFEGPFSDNILIIILINANFLLLVTVIFMMARSLWKLSEERKQGVHGARFRTKLVAAFVSLSFIPPVLLFLIGSGMFTRSIERLFSLKIESSLQDSVSLAQAYYDQLRDQGRDFGKKISRQIAEGNLLQEGDSRYMKEFLQTRAADYGLGAVELFISGRPR